MCVCVCVCDKLLKFVTFSHSLTRTMPTIFDTVMEKKAKEPITQLIVVQKSSWGMHQVKEIAMVS